MKILIIQLARLGDIYMTWPVVRSLKRAYPDSEIHMMVRERFAAATVGLDELSKTHVLTTGLIVEKLVHSVDSATQELGDFLDSVRSEKFDKVINLSFSPLSSFFTYELGKTAQQTLGYTRFDDSSFALKESLSAYYFSQVGIDKHNRFHLIDLFVTLCGVDLISEDFSYPVGFSFASPIHENYITVQLGASQSNKTLSPFIWSRAIKNFLNFNLGYKVVLIGSPEEKDLADEVFAFNSHSDIINLIGKTNIQELFPILKNSSLHVGGDSVCVQICNLTNTPCLNLSFESVKFWETGPRSKGSFVLLNINPSHVESKEVALGMKTMLCKGRMPQLIGVIPDSPNYDLKFDLVNDFEWNLIKAIYLGDPFPVSENLLFYKGVEKLSQTNDLIIETLTSAKDSGVANYVKILSACDESFMSIRTLSPKLSVYIDWCLGEKIKVPPLTEIEIVESYLRVHTELKGLLRPYVLEDVTQDEGKVHG